MRFKKTLLALSLATLITISGLSCTRQTINEAYDYPTKPGTDAWKALGSLDAMFNACQIPEATLSKLTTSALVETVLNYPLLMNYLAYNNPQQGFDMLVSHFNGLQELFKREDAGTILLMRYHNMYPTEINDDWTDAEKGFYSFSFSNIEMLLAQEQILDNLTETQCQELVSEALIKYEAKLQQTEIYGFIAQESTALLMARVMQHAKYTPFMQELEKNTELKSFLTKGSFATDSVMNEILSTAKQFIHMVPESGMVHIIFSLNWILNNDAEPDPNTIKITFPESWLTDAPLILKNDSPVELSVPRRLLDDHNGSKDPGFYTVVFPNYYFKGLPDLPPY